ncbi:MAG: hypothetical protein QOJ73_3329 [Streptosporangiaceae bacterium]|jgi:hypothetical protein|nr:hypothetical protein [Streptosporangiaceae bacterium]
MATGMLPEDGELRLGPVTLPSGKRIVPPEGPEVPVAWVTTEAVFYPGLVWSVLSDMRQETGLVPIVLPYDPNTISSNVCFYLPSSISELDHMDAAQTLATLWNGNVSPDDDEFWAAAYAPFSAQFPGLAPPEDARLSEARLHEVLSALPAACIGLVPAQRPADVLPVTGWVGPDCNYPDNLSLATILRSWEDRFGARLLFIGPSAEIQLLVQRPPRNFESAQRIAAEHFAFCDAFCEDYGKPTRIDRTTIIDIAPVLVNAPTWSFWWD